MNIEESLKRGAYKVWDELEPIRQNSNFKIFEVREEALTTMFLKELIRSNCSDIEKIEMTSPQEESISGSDFEIVIGSKLKGKFIRLFVQAKTLKGKHVRSNYNEIDYEQTDKLISYSRSESSLGVYAFFNHLIENDLTLINHYNSGTPYDKKSMGITITSAYTVKMLGSKKFTDFHFNSGIKINPSIYSLRFFPHLFYFHKDSKSHLSIPIHELSYLKIELAEKINRLYRLIKARSKSYFFFFFFPWMDELFNSDKNIIPIIESNIEKIISDFRMRVKVNNIDYYKPQFLLIINTDNEFDS